MAPRGSGPVGVALPAARRRWQPGPPLTPAFSALPEAGGGPASGRSPRRPAARGGARGLSPGAGEFWESPAQGGGLAAARAAVRAARRARRARSEGAAPGWAHTGTRGGRAGGGGSGPRRACGAGAAAGGAPQAVPPGHSPGSCALLAAALPLTYSSGTLDAARDRRVQGRRCAWRRRRDWPEEERRYSNWIFKSF